MDSKARVKAAGESIAHLTRMEKLKWVDTQRQLGNEAYHQKEYSNAAEIYVQVRKGQRRYWRCIFMIAWIGSCRIGFWRQ